MPVMPAEHIMAAEHVRWVAPASISPVPDSNTGSCHMDTELNDINLVQGAEGPELDESISCETSGDEHEHRKHER